ncbi:MAG: CUAEP/CCAEP-tail radical SAM protein [Chloroflexi bacterium]|nr:CUAEP/CCAEP-tail radical SAM protein [Chloroflexota bacterium]
MRALLISTYELGHQPLHSASASGALLQAGHEVRCLDLSVEMWDDATVTWADAVAISVPMHTATRLAERAAQRIRQDNPDTPIAFYGLYAGMEHHPNGSELADAQIAGAYEHGLVGWLDGVALRDGAVEPQVDLERRASVMPARHLLPDISRYAHMALGDDESPVGYTEASRGCVHTCRHCPVPIVYVGRIRIIEPDVVLADIDQLVAAGARHITFADPDFLNGVRHSERVVRAMHARHPHLTFDVTTKVEHILEHADIWEEFAVAGCLFVVSAFESVNDEILRRLDKGHTAAEAAQAVAQLRRHGIEIRPSWMPFTPWTTPADVLDILEFVREQDLIANVDPVQFTIRLLVPQGSLLLDLPELIPHLRGYDEERLTYLWHANDPRADNLQEELAGIVERGIAEESSDAVLFERLWMAVRAAAPDVPAGSPPSLAGRPLPVRPRLTEPWFCCAEPTDMQFSPLEEIPA